MSLIRRVAAGYAAERRAADGRLPWGSSVPPTNSEVGFSSAAGPLTSTVVQQHSTVYSCCSVLADSVSSIPGQIRNAPEVATSKPIPPSPLLLQPYSEISRADWWKQFVWALALRGNFYGEIIDRDSLGNALQVKPISNDGVKIRRLGNGQLEYRYYNKPTSIDNVVHVRYQTLPGAVEGVNPIQACALSFGLSIAQERYAEQFFLNSANPTGVIQVPGALDRSETRRMLRGWLAAHQGLNKAHLPAILTEGAEFKSISISPNDSQLLEAMQASRALIAGTIFRVPLHMVGILDKSSSWGRGLEVQERSFLSTTLIGYLAPAVEMMNRLLPTGQFFHFDMRERLRGTALERAQTAALMRSAGAWTADDARATFDQAPLPDGAGAYTTVPINSELLAMALESLKQAKEADQAPPGEGETPEPGSSTPTPSAGAPAAGGARAASDERDAMIESLTHELSRATAMRRAGKLANGNGHDKIARRDAVLALLLDD